MEISINQRLKKLVDDKKINAPALYKKIGVERGTWSGWVNSNKAISVEKLVLIIKELNDINARWFITGEGNMTEETAQHVTEEPKQNYNTQCPLCKEKDLRIGLLEIMCQEREEKIELLKSEIDWLKGKKETAPKNSAQRRQASNE